MAQSAWDDPKIWDRSIGCLAVCSGNKLHVCRYQTRELLSMPLPDGLKPQSVSYHSSGKALFLGGSNGNHAEVRLFANMSNLACKFPTLPSSPILMLNDNNSRHLMLAVCKDDPSIYHFDLKSLQKQEENQVHNIPVQQLRQHDKPIDSMDCCYLGPENGHKQSLIVVVSSSQNQVAIAHAVPGQPLQPANQLHVPGQGKKYLAFGNTCTLVVASADGTVCFWNNLLNDYSSPPITLTEKAAAPVLGVATTSHEIIVVSTNGQMAVWDIATKRYKGLLACKLDIHSMAAHHDSRLLALGSADGQVKVMSLEHDQPLNPTLAAYPTFSATYTLPTLSPITSLSWLRPKVGRPPPPPPPSATASIAAATAAPVAVATQQPEPIAAVQAPMAGPSKATAATKAGVPASSRQPAAAAATRTAPGQPPAATTQLHINPAKPAANAPNQAQANSRHLVPGVTAVQGKAAATGAIGTSAAGRGTTSVQGSTAVGRHTRASADGSKATASAALSSNLQHQSTAAAPASGKVPEGMTAVTSMRQQAPHTPGASSTEETDMDIAITPGPTSKLQTATTGNSLDQWLSKPKNLAANMLPVPVNPPSSASLLSNHTSSARLAKSTVAVPGLTHATPAVPSTTITATSTAASATTTNSNVAATPAFAIINQAALKEATNNAANVVKTSTVQPEVIVDKKVASTALQHSIQPPPGTSSLAKDAAASATITTSRDKSGQAAPTSQPPSSTNSQAPTPTGSGPRPPVAALSVSIPRTSEAGFNSKSASPSVSARVAPGGPASQAQTPQYTPGNSNPSSPTKLKQAAASSKDEPLTFETFKNFMETHAREDVRNLHLEMINQFVLQEMRLDAMLQRQQQLESEVAQLKQMMHNMVLGSVFGGVQPFL